MPQQRRTPEGRTSRRRVIYAECTEREHAEVLKFVRQEGLTVSDFIRRCVNSYLVEVSEDSGLLAEMTADRNG